MLDGRHPPVNAVHTCCPTAAAAAAASLAGCLAGAQAGDMLVFGNSTRAW